MEQAGNFDCTLSSWIEIVGMLQDRRVFTWGMFEGPGLLNLAHISHMSLINHPGNVGGGVGVFYLGGYRYVRWGNRECCQ